MSIQLHYQQLGNSDGETLIFLHGLFGSGRNLQTLARQFASDYRIILLDLRNHGQSPHHKDMNYLVMNEDLVDFIQEKAIHSPILIGHSMGGKIAMVNALQAPDHSRAIIVLDIAPVDYGIDYIPLIDTLLSLKLEQFKSRNEADHELGKSYDNSVFRQFLLQNLVNVDGRFHWRLNLPAIRNNIQAIKSFPALSQPTYRKPALFLRGQDSDYVLAKDEEIISRFFPAATVATIPGAGHWLQADQPKRVADRIEQFLSSLP